MSLANSEAAGCNLHGFVDAFESAWRRQGHAEPAEFLPPPGHPLYRQVLCELLRVDLELHWSAGRPKRVEDYRAQFPALFEDIDAVREIALEECRLRRQAGEEPDLDECLRRAGIRKLDGQSGHPTECQADESDKSSADPPTVRLSDVAPPSEAIQLHLIDAWCASVADKPGVGDALRDFRQADPGGASRVAQAVSAIPQSGEEFLGFRLLAELGRGAFGRVFLAQQSALANRLVALKIGADLFAESQTLAQLQHTNIVPIYSLHRAGQLQAVCMPFFGSTTFGDVVKNLEAGPSMPGSGKAFISTLKQRHSVTSQSLTASRKGATASATVVSPSSNAHPSPEPGPRHHSTADLAQLEKLSYAEAVLWIAAHLAKGLAHAHDRGIVHLDLKPTNILLADEGQPMLLDFNLSDDMKVRGSALGARMGGTLPYMSPEQLEAFQGKARVVDGRSDLYSLGVILCELLSGQHPFPRQTGSLDTLLPRMLEDRSCPRAILSRLPTTVSPAVSSIIRKCLQVDPAKRYQSAHDLAEDLDRHLNHLPLRYASETSVVERSGKWVRRHPRWTVSLLVALIAAMVIGSPAAWLVVRDRELARTARDTREFVEQEVPAIRSLLNDANVDSHQIEEGIKRTTGVLQRYQVLDDPSWQKRTTVTYLPPKERERLVEDLR
jgi:serine/threonine protein kinase